MESMEPMERQEYEQKIKELSDQIQTYQENHQWIEELKTQQAVIKSRGLTKEILYEKFIEKWDGKTPIYVPLDQLIKTSK